MAPAPVPVPVPVENTECGEVGSDDPVTGKKQCILARQVTQISSQSSSDMLYDTKVNAYESFTNPPLPMDRLVFLSYVVFVLIVICVASVFLSNMSAVRKNFLLTVAFLLLLLLSLLQKRDVGR
jgi:hypothetical protein